jgi:ankyrin repeat protein
MTQQMNASSLVNRLCESNTQESRSILQNLKQAGCLTAVNTVGCGLVTPLYLSASAGHLAKVGLLIAHGAKDSIVQGDEVNGFSNSLSALYIAAKRSHAVVVNYLLKHGARTDLKMKDDHGLTHFFLPSLVHSYCSWGYREEPTPETRSQQVLCLGDILTYATPETCARILNQHLYAGHCALELAFMAGRGDLVEVLWSFGARWEALDDAGKRADVLIHATEQGHLATIQWICRHFGLDVNLVSSDKVPLLHIAKTNRYEEIVQFLLDKGANPSARTKNGETYEAYAGREISQHAAKSFVNYLKDGIPFRGFENPDKFCSDLRLEDIGSVVDTQGNTLLHLAAKFFGWPWIYTIWIPALLRRGGKKVLEIRNCMNQTPLEVAEMVVGEAIAEAKRNGHENEARELRKKIQALYDNLV